MSVCVCVCKYMRIHNKYLHIFCNNSTGKQSLTLSFFLTKTHAYTMYSSPAVTQWAVYKTHC